MSGHALLTEPDSKFGSHGMNVTFLFIVAAAVCHVIIIVQVAAAAAAAAASSPPPARRTYSKKLALTCNKKITSGKRNDKGSSGGSERGTGETTFPFDVTKGPKELCHLWNFCAAARHVFIFFAALRFLFFFSFAQLC